MNNFVCKIPSIEEMNVKWDYEIENSKSDKNNWIIWKKEAILNAKNGYSIPYYGILDENIICEATAMLNPNKVQNYQDLVDDKTVYLIAFRTKEEYQGKGYFSKLFKFMLDDLKKRGFTKVTLGVEPKEEKNKQIYEHYGFNEFIKSSSERYPDGTVIDVDYYGKKL